MSTVAGALQPTRPAPGPVQRLAALLLVGPGPYARAFENLILGLILLSVASIGVAAIPTLPGWATSALRVEEVIVVVVSSFEYLLRIVAAPGKFAFIFSFEGLVDLLAIAPAFLVGLDTRWLRALRLLRLLRLLKLGPLGFAFAGRTNASVLTRVVVSPGSAEIFLIDRRSPERLQPGFCCPCGGLPLLLRLGGNL